jgi:hypothetical protein
MKVIIDHKTHIASKTTMTQQQTEDLNGFVKHQRLDVIDE